MNKNNEMAIRTMMRLRCGYMEEGNKYWLCVFCGKGRDNMEHSIGECEVTMDWFKGLGNNKKEREKKIWEDDLNKVKAEILKKLWKEKEGKKKKREKETKTRNCDTTTSR